MGSLIGVEERAANRFVQVFHRALGCGGWINAMRWERDGGGGQCKATRRRGRRGLFSLMKKAIMLLASPVRLLLRSCEMVELACMRGVVYILYVACMDSLAAWEELARG